MAMSPNELKALLSTMDTLIALLEVVRAKGNVDQVAELREQYEKLRDIRRLARGQGLGRQSKDQEVS